MDIVYADITQLVECHPYKMEVGSSSLSVGTDRNPALSNDDWTIATDMGGQEVRWLDLIIVAYPSWFQEHV